MTGEIERSSVEPFAHYVSVVVKQSRNGNVDAEAREHMTRPCVLHALAGCITALLADAALHPSASVSRQLPPSNGERLLVSNWQHTGSMWHQGNFPRSYLIIFFYLLTEKINIVSKQRPSFNQQSLFPALVLSHPVEGETENQKLKSI